MLWGSAACAGAALFRFCVFERQRGCRHAGLRSYVCEHPTCVACVVGHACSGDVQCTCNVHMSHKTSS